MENLHTAQLNLQPDVIEFSAGQPSPRLLPLELLREAAASRLGIDDASYLAYGAEQGDGYFRQTLAKYLSGHYQMQVDYNDLFITSGASQGLDLVCTLFSRPGDTIFVEEPSYFLALRIFVDHGLKIVCLPTDDQGLVIEALEKKLLKCTPSFLYTIPTFHNPSSVTLSADRRDQLVQLGRQHNFPIIADEVYHLLAYNSAPPSPLVSFAADSPVISLGSFSKIMAPGLRLGWVQARAELLSRFSACGLVDSGGGLNPFTSGVVRSAIELGLLDRQVTQLKAVYQKRKLALAAELRSVLPDSVRFIEPDGGFFIWLELSEYIDTVKMLAIARQHGIGYLPGTKFSGRGGLKNYLRLSFAYYDVPELREGAQRLAKVIGEY